MADAPIIPMGDEPAGATTPAADIPIAPQEATQRLWQRGGGLSSVWGAIGDNLENFLGQAGFDKAPWLAVVFACGILTWFGLKSPWAWAATIGLSLIFAGLAVAAWRDTVARDYLRNAVVACTLVFAAGICVVWLRSEAVGAEAIERPTVQRVQGYVLSREDQPSQDRIRLVMAVRDATSAQSRKIRVNVPLEVVAEANAAHGTGTGMGMLSEGAVVRLQVRLMPPASPMLPGAYDFARAAWFKGLAGTGSVIGTVEIIEPASDDGVIARAQRWLSSHVRDNVDGSAGTIAAAFASGDRGAISEADQDAMRDAGLTHLLAISGLHVSAVIAGAYLLAIKLLALFPGLALRVRLPVVAAGVGAIAGISYTLLTGAQVPTVRACAAAMLVLLALATGREALSLRMVAMAAVFVLMLWPESVVGPSFQMSFAAVLAIVALHSSAPVQAFLAPREESYLARLGRGTAMLFLTGLVIEIALMPIVLFHFHRAGLYGAAANVFAIPLVTFISMPLIALGLIFDLVGLGTPFWWLTEKSLNLLLGIAHFTSAQPGAVKLMPQMSGLAITLFVAGGLWLALWSGRARLLGFVPAAIATGLLLATPIPDVLIGREGRHVGITVTDDGDKQWSLLLARNRSMIEERALAAACEQADIVVADRFLPRSCLPRWLKADRRFLEQSGGLALDLANERIISVATSQGEHGWWRAGEK